MGQSLFFIRRKGGEGALDNDLLFFLCGGWHGGGRNSMVLLKS